MWAHRRLPQPAAHRTPSGFLSPSPRFRPAGSAPPILASRRGTIPPLTASHGLSPPLTLGPNALLRVRIRLLPLLLLLLHPPTRADRPRPPTSETLTLAVVGTAWPARLSSARGLPEHLDAPAASMAAPPPVAEKPDEGVEIRDVWAGNLEEEFAVISDIVDAYPYVSMDTEFPGFVVQPASKKLTYVEHNYAILEGNVNVLKLIQVGLTLSDENGELPQRGTGGRACIWQFNFRDFDPRTDPNNTNSIDLLRRSGIDFDRFVAEGVDATRFAELLMSSGVVCNDDIRWITFHGGHDIGYLLKLLTGRVMPETLDEFLSLNKVFFPVMYDVKHLMTFCGGELFGGLNRLGELLKVERVGIGHQAGSDSLLTLQCFKKIKDLYLKESVKMYVGVLWGLIPGEGENKAPPPAIE